MSNINKNTGFLTKTALLSAIIIIMSFTPIGYLKVSAVEISFIPVVVSIGAVFLGLKGGALLGSVFGISSFLQCFGFSPFGTTLFSVNPLSTFILCLVPRILMGYLSGLAFYIAQKNSFGEKFACAAAGLAAPLLNSIFFCIGLVLLFGNTAFFDADAKNHIVKYVIGLVWINSLAEAIICTIVSTAITFPLMKLVKNYGNK